MKNSTKALKTLSLILASLVFVLFFLFLFTFDFTPRKAYSYVTKEETSIRDDFEKSVMETMDQNYLSIDIEGDDITRTIYSLINRDDKKDMYESETWTIKGLSVDIIRGRIVLNIYSIYHGNFRYNLKIRAFLTLTETSEGFLLQVDSISFGALFIPKRNIRKVLKSTSEGTIGFIIREALNAIPFGSYDSNELSYSITINDIIQSIEREEFLKQLNNDHKSLKYLLMAYILESYRASIFSFEFTNRIRFNFDYSRLINAVDRTPIQSIEQAKKETLSIVFKHLMLQDELTLSDKEISSLLKTKFEKFGSNESINLTDSKIKIYDDTIHLILSINIYQKKTNIDFSFKEADGYYSLKRIEIGRDDLEKESNYLVIESQESLTYLSKFLSAYGFKMTSFTRRLDENSILNGTHLTFSDSIIKDSRLNVKMESDLIYRNAINYILKSDEFKEYLGDLSHLLDYTDDESLILSFSRLTPDNKENYFKKIKSFTKDESSLYNYIINFLWEEVGND